MAIEKITIENFKPFGGRAELELCPITVLIGANSSGKSSIIHALGPLRRSVQQSRMR